MVRAFNVMPKTAEGNTLQLLREKNPEQFEEFKGLRVPKGSKKKGFLFMELHASPQLYFIGPTKGSVKLFLEFPNTLTL